MKNHVETSKIAQMVGRFLFVVGELGNGYHHYLLAKLRKDKSQSGNQNKYSIPSGGLFSFAGGSACPHYLFEILAWLGIAVVSQQFNTYLVTLSMAFYLGRRSVATSNWNKKNIKDYPTSKKNMIPGIF